MSLSLSSGNKACWWGHSCSRIPFAAAACSPTALGERRETQICRGKETSRSGRLPWFSIFVVTWPCIFPVGWRRVSGPVRKKILLGLLVLSVGLNLPSLHSCAWLPAELLSDPGEEWADLGCLQLSDARADSGAWLVFFCWAGNCETSASTFSLQSWESPTGSPFSFHCSEFSFHCFLNYFQSL